MSNDYLKEIYFDFNQKRGLDIDRKRNLHEAEKELETILSAWKDCKDATGLEIAVGAFGAECEYRGFLLGLLAASENKKLCGLI